MFPLLISVFSCEGSHRGVTSPQPVGSLSLRLELNHAHLVLCTLNKQARKVTIAQLVSAKKHSSLSIAVLCFPHD